MRMLDKLHTYPVLWPQQVDNHPEDDIELAMLHTRYARDIATGVTCIEATNIAKYFEQHYVSDASWRKHTAKDFFKSLKCLSPPYKKLWIEWQYQSRRLGIDSRRGAVYLRYGEPHAMAKYAEEIIPNAEHTPKRMKEMAQNPFCRWIAFGVTFVEFDQHQIRGPYNWHIFSIGMDGSVIDAHINDATNEITQDEIHQVGMESLVAWLALAFMNCNNVHTQKHVPSKTLNKNRAKKGKRSLISYRTISVDPSAPGHTGGTAGKGQGRVALHQVRGHMKTYGGKGLFGKHKGTWYWGPRLAGTAECGINVNDYTVEAKNVEEERQEHHEVSRSG